MHRTWFSGSVSFPPCELRRNREMRTPDLKAAPPLKLIDGAKASEPLSFPLLKISEILNLVVVANIL